MGIYNFKADDAWAFAKSQHLSPKQRGAELVLKYCPYCNGGLNEDKGTFSINLNTGQFQCKRASCQMKGNMVTLSKDFAFSLGSEVDNYYKNAMVGYRQHRKFKRPERIVTRPKAYEYLAGRGISPAVVERFEITTKEDNENILVFPFRDDRGELVFVKYRKTDFVKGKDKAKEWSEKDCKPILFGMNQASPEKENGTLIITEGQIDSLSVATVGIENAVSVPTGANGFTWVPYCYDFVNKFAKIVVFGDCEKGSVTLADEIAKRWPMKTAVCEIEDYKGCKDANELLQKHGADAVKAAVANAKLVTSKRIVPLAEYESINVKEMHAYKTGIPALDEVLDDGYRMGQLAVLTGPRGEGKSTLASQMGAFALEQDLHCFFYSGELIGSQFREWMDGQICGHVVKLPSEKEKLNRFYGDRAFLFDNQLVSDEDDEFAPILPFIEEAIIKKNCRFIIVDNMMTAMCEDATTDLYRQQARFTTQLSRMAKRFNVFILLIAHPKKMNGSGNVQNDDVAGSSDITNRADLVLTFQRQADEAPDVRYIRVIKNRLTGKLTPKDEPIRVVYDKNSRRLAEHTEDFRNISFSWQHENDELDEGFYSLDLEEEIPF